MDLDLVIGGDFDFLDPAERAILADALEEAGREEEALLCREEWVLCGEGGAVVIDLEYYRLMCIDCVGDVPGRLRWATALERMGESRMAEVQRELAGLAPYAELSADDRVAVAGNYVDYHTELGAVVGEYDVSVQENTDDDLAVCYFDIYDAASELPDDGPYVICRGRGDLLLGEVRRRAGLSLTP